MTAWKGYDIRQARAYAEAFGWYLVRVGAKSPVFVLIHPHTLDRVSVEEVEDAITGNAPRDERPEHTTGGAR